VSQPPQDGIARRAFAAAAPTPPLAGSAGPGNAAGEHRAVGVEPLPDNFQAELVEPAERGQVRAGEGSVTQRRGLPGMTIPAAPAWETSTCLPLTTR
jgi:hypothetical protein